MTKTHFEQADEAPHSYRRANSPRGICCLELACLAKMCLKHITPKAESGHKSWKYC